MKTMIRSNESRLKIFHLISGDLWAGAEVMACNLLKSLPMYSDLEISVGLLNEGRLAEELRLHGLEVTVFDEHKLSFLKLVTEINNFLRKKSPRIIHSHRYKENILAFFTSRLRPSGSLLVATQHGMPEPGPDRFLSAGHLIARFNRYLLTHLFDQVIGVSNDICKTFIGELKFSPKKVSVIHNGIEMPESISFRSSRPMTVVGSAGRFFPVKDYPFMVEIAKEAAKKASLNFELAGEGPERPEIEQRIADSGIGGSFQLLGHLEDMNIFYTGLDIYLNTSVHEGIPMSIIEAMAHGLPVVAPKVGGISEMITDGVEGFLIPGRDPKRFAEKCVLLHKEPELRKRMGIAARAKVEKDFSAAAMAKQYYRLYRELAGS